MLGNDLTFGAVGLPANDIPGATPDVVDPLCGRPPVHALPALPPSIIASSRPRLPTGGTANRNTAVAPPSATVYRLERACHGAAQHSGIPANHLHHAGLIRQKHHEKPIISYSCRRAGAAAQPGLYGAGARPKRRWPISLSSRSRCARQPGPHVYRWSSPPRSVWPTSATTPTPPPILGYFDPGNATTTYTTPTTPAKSYFQPAAFATGANSHTCSGYWSGNFMNWATMQTIDPFRWALTGGYRSVDTTTQTILEKAWGVGPGRHCKLSRSRDRVKPAGNMMPGSVAISVSRHSALGPLSISRIWATATGMVFSGDASSYSCRERRYKI